LAASLLVAALGALVYGMWLKSREGHVQYARQTTLEPADGIPDQQGLLTLASLKLPAACLPASYRPLSAEQAITLAAAIADESRAALRCCTECHYAGGSRTMDGRLVALVAGSCQSCHR